MAIENVTVVPSTSYPRTRSRRKRAPGEETCTLCVRVGSDVAGRVRGAVMRGEGGSVSAVTEEALEEWLARRAA